MAIVLPQGRPAIDVIDGTFERPEEPWAHLGDPAVRARLERAIAAVGRVRFSPDPDSAIWGTAFVVGPNLVLSSAGQPGADISGVVDFRHELRPGDSVSVELREAVYVDSRQQLVLFRAELPANIEPLCLAAQPPATLAAREVVLLGYPAADARNDAAVLRQIFRGALGVKRVLPGRVRGQEESKFGTEGPVVVHDCSSTAGCGGAPLVDVETGEVLGVHFAGVPLVANYAAATWELARDERFASAGVRFAGELPASVAPRADAEEGAGELPASVAPRADVEESAGAPPTVESLSPDDMAEIASTIAAAAGAAAAQLADANRAPEGDRPALPARQWEAALSSGWTPLLAPRKARLDVVVRAVGKVLNGIGEHPWSGTAFLVGDRLALTASFVAEAFAGGAGLRTSLQPGKAAAVDFSDALGQPAGTATTAVTGIRFIHPYFHVALLELGELPEGIAVLELAAQLPSQLSGRLLALISFSAAADGLRIQPGQALQISEIPGHAHLPALAHDCASAMGSAGGPLIDLGTGYVVGVHTHAGSREGGLAQPTWELARDPYVWDHPIRFRPDPRPPWLAEWRNEDAQPPANVAPAPPTGDGRWTVDQAPIDWSRPEPRDIEKILIDTIDVQMAPWWAENAGIQLGAVNPLLPPQVMWRLILKAAASAALLRRLLEQIADAPEFAGIAPKLRAYL
jgi:Trypsin-like peptidase domain